MTREDRERENEEVRERENELSIRAIGREIQTSIDSNDPAVLLQVKERLGYIIEIMESTAIKERWKEKWKGKGNPESDKKIKELRKRFNQINSNFRKLTEDRR